MANMLFKWAALIICAASYSWSFPCKTIEREECASFQYENEAVIPSIEAFQSNTRFIAVHTVPSLTCVDIVTTYMWSPGGTAEIHCQMPELQDYYSALQKCTDSNGVTGYVFTRPVSMCTFSQSTTNPIVLSALETAWRQLALYTYYKEMGFDGTASYIDTYDNQGLQRRLTLWSPSEAHCGRDLLLILNLVAEQTLLAQAPPLFMRCPFPNIRNWYDPEYTGLGSLPQIGTLELLQLALTGAVQVANDNEECVAAYIVSPCIRRENEIFGETEGCYVHAYPPNWKSYEYPGER